ncbi:hypothetical protein [Winogradskyella sp. A3E31]|uniref:hypothetical protein n=1 Tax=Winogradskyella sp. A3E31 TaxID=3349637 RepID=UPI00398A8738
MTYNQLIIEIIKNVRSRITDHTDVAWTKYNDAKELKEELDSDIKELEGGNLKLLEKYKIYFLPTGTFQEISIPNGWAEDFVKLANSFDQMYELIKSDMQ